MLDNTWMSSGDSGLIWPIRSRVSKNYIHFPLPLKCNKANSHHPQFPLTERNFRDRLGSSSINLLIVVRFWQEDQLLLGLASVFILQGVMNTSRASDFVLLLFFLAHVSREIHATRTEIFFTDALKQLPKLSWELWWIELSLLPQAWPPPSGLNKANCPQMKHPNM